MAKRILVIDDSATVRRQVAEALTGFEIIEAADGLAGLDVITNEHDVALVFCDVNMPRLSGLEMLEAWRERGSHPNWRVVMLTTEGQPSMVRRARELGAKGWLVKPFDPVQLLAVARKLAA